MEVIITQHTLTMQVHLVVDMEKHEEDDLLFLVVNIILLGDIDPVY